MALAAVVDVPPTVKNTVGFPLSAYMKGPQIDAGFALPKSHGTVDSTACRSLAPVAYSMPAILPVDPGAICAGVRKWNTATLLMLNPFVVRREFAQPISYCCTELNPAAAHAEATSVLPPPPPPVDPVPACVIVKGLALGAEYVHVTAVASVLAG